MKHIINSFFIIFFMLFVSSCGILKTVNTKTKNDTSNVKPVNNQKVSNVVNQKVSSVDKQKQTTTVQTQVVVKETKPVEEVIKPKQSEIIVLEAKELSPEEKLIKAKEEGFVFTKNDEIVFLAKENIGIRYLSGGTTTKGMDCSGMVYTTFKHADMKVPRSSGDLANFGTKISKNEAVPGDLIFFKTNGRSVINHVGIITEVTENDIKFVHASVHRGVIISSLSEAYYTKAFAKINRVLN